jgi:hypothetical protein
MNATKRYEVPEFSTDPEAKMTMCSFNYLILIETGSSVITNYELR